MSKQIDSNKQIASLSTIPTTDLALVTGGYKTGANGQTDQGSGSGSTDSTTTTVNLTCPSGTAPHYTKITGSVDATVAGGTVKIGGNGSYTDFSCQPVPTTKK